MPGGTVCSHPAALKNDLILIPVSVITLFVTQVLFCAVFVSASSPDYALVMCVDRQMIKKS